MDDLGFNKIAGAILATGLGIMVLTKLPGIFMPEADASIAYKVGSIEASASDAEPVDLPFPQADWIAAMDAERGAKVFKKCVSCHNADEGGANGTGPALWGVVGTDKASNGGFNYSAVLTGLEGNWGYEDLDAFLEKPSAYASGTKMSFIGLKKPADRAAVIEYMRVNGSTDLPRPVAAAAESMEESGEAMVEKTEEMVKDGVETVMEKTEEMVKDGGDVMMEKAEEVMEKVEPNLGSDQ